MSPQQRVLAGDGEFLVTDSLQHTNPEPTDYSYLVFPFAKMYEGFLKQILRDVGIITEEDYRSEHFRIGKALSPTLANRLGPRSAYAQLQARFSKDLATRLWHTWKEARNLVFHYFPHNYRALNREGAMILIQNITNAMEQAVHETRVHPRPHDN
jgi:hypothetical protein